MSLSPLIPLAPLMTIFLLNKRDITVQLFSFLLGHVSNESPTRAAILFCTALLVDALLIIALPRVKPGVILTETQDKITETRIWLDDEATTRRASRMYDIALRGHTSLKSVEQRAQTLLSYHKRGCTIRNAFRYVVALPSLILDARKCHSDITALRSDLEDEVRQLDDNQ